MRIFEALQCVSLVGVHMKCNILYWSLFTKWSSDQPKQKAFMDLTTAIHCTIGMRWYNTLRDMTKTSHTLISYDMKWNRFKYLIYILISSLSNSNFLFHLCKFRISQTNSQHPYISPQIRHKLALSQKKWRATKDYGCSADTYSAPPDYSLSMRLWKEQDDKARSGSAVTAVWNRTRHRLPSRNHEERRYQTRFIISASINKLQWPPSEHSIFNNSQWLYTLLWMLKMNGAHWSI